MENFTPIKTEKKKKKFNKLLIIGNLLLVVIMAIGGYFYYNNVLLTKEQKAEGTEPIDCKDPSIVSQTAGCYPSDGDYSDPKFVCEGINRSECKYSGENHCLIDANGCVDGKKVSGFPSCPPSTPNLLCGGIGEPGAMYDTNFRGTCGQYFPAKWAGPGGNCQINCLCCPSGSTYNCVTSSNTYEYATESRKKYICQNNSHADKYISSKPNPAYNSSLPPEDNPLCTEDGIKANGNINWNCLDTLTTCAPSVCSCGTITVASPTPTPTTPPSATNTPIPTATDVPVLTNTPIPTNTPTSTPTNTPTMTPTGTIVPSNTPTVTPTGTIAPTNTPTSTPVISNTPGPSATPTEIILAQVSASPTGVTNLLQTGVVKSFMYFIPAIIILIGLIL
ncbi:MAG: hypothetical protein WC894_01635 [Patescibacteria group bacterium]